MSGQLFRPIDPNDRAIEGEVGCEDPNAISQQRIEIIASRADVIDSLIDERLLNKRAV